MKQREIFWLLARYIVLFVLALSNLWIIYNIFRPLTIYPVVWLLDKFYGAYLIGNMISFNGLYIEIIPACIAASAYYLLLILNLTTPMRGIIRIKSIIFSLFTFLVVNIFRIIFFAIIFSWGFVYFSILHKITWYFISTVMVILIWFGTTWLFSIRDIPIYSDVKKILKNVKH